MVDKKNDMDDFDDDLLDDLDGEPVISKKGPVAEDKESAKSKLSKIFGKKSKIEDYPAVHENNGNGNSNNDELTDSTPKVSMATKKNVALIGIISLVLFYFVYAVFIKDDKRKKKVASTETEEMKEEFRSESKVPEMSQKKTEEFDRREEQIQQMQQLQQQSQNPVSAIDIAAPSPPPPPTFETGSAYIDDLESSSSEDEDEEDEDFDEDLDLDEDEDDDSGGASSEQNSGFSKSGGVLVRNNFAAPVATTGNQQGLPQLSGTGVQNGQVVTQDIQQQLNAPMFAASAAEEIKEEKDADEDDPFAFKLGKSGAANEQVTTVGNLNNLILQGKVLDAVIETAINTDLPGKLRGIVSRDVYAESGKKVLIPKGSRLIGTYDTQIKFGQARVFIIWTRVIRPDGIDAVLDSREDMIAVDLLGRTGVVGDIDNRFAEIFGSSILLSTITIAFSYAADALTDAGQVTSTVTQDGNVVESGSNLALGTRQAVSDLGSKVQSIARDLVNVSPRITIDQGTRIKVFVNKDIYFPAEINEEDTLTVIK